MQENEFLHFGNEGYIYDLFTKYQQDKESIPIEWLRFFQGMELSESISRSSPPSKRGTCEVNSTSLLNYFKRFGYLYAKSNSLTSQQVFNRKHLLSYLQLTEEDLEKKITIEELNIKELPLLEVIDRLQDKYCGNIGIEFFSSRYLDKQEWLFDKFYHREHISKEQYLKGLKKVAKATMLEEFFQKKYLGVKRFSIEGGESVISLIHSIIDHAATINYKETYIAMAHRGRVNTLCNVMEKPYREIFQEFDKGRFPQKKGLGDVKYHNSYKNQITLESGHEMLLYMPPNPSHLEAVDPVFHGMIRARIDDGLEKALGIVIHGDAAISGQGIVYETMQFDQIEGYSNKGSIHIVIDNQIGFTALPSETRSTMYPTDIAKVCSSPVLHVDSSCLEEVLVVGKLAMEYVEQFHTDIFIHFNCYRKYGHNEADEPMFTNPTLYKEIREKSSLYEELKLSSIQKGYIKEHDLEKHEEQVKALLTSEYEQLDKGGDSPSEDYLSFDDKIEEEYPSFDDVKTALSKSDYTTVSEVVSKVPDNIVIHPKIIRLIEQRKKALVSLDEKLLDWGTAEMMAYGSLVAQGKSVRLSGQDCRRGTFSHRHSVYFAQDNNDAYFPLDQIKKGRFSVYNSPLSEYGVMGFEFGYSLKKQNGLVIWEAQFGDFFNGASIIIDQYISSTQSKWNEHSSLVLYLPHGMEGMGPEHSSGRIERFLQLCGRGNMRVYIPTTSAQIFHLIRAQAEQKNKVPLVVFTPKSQLRTPSSSAKELMEGSLQKILVKGNLSSKKVVFCAGKLAKEIEDFDTENSCGIISLEQLYPFPQQAVKQALEKFSLVERFIYAQEEPKNQGAYSFCREYIEQIIGKKTPLEYVGRKRLESTATGFSSVHKYEQKKILEKVVKG